MQLRPVLLPTRATAIPESANDEQSAARQELETLSEGSVRIKSKRKDDRNLITEAQQKNYDLAFNRSQLAQADGKILGLFAYSALPNGITETQTKDDPARTSTHTSTPVLVFTQGPGDTSAPFGKVLHHTEVGQRAIEALED